MGQERQAGCFQACEGKEGPVQGCWGTAVSWGQGKWAHGAQCQPQKDGGVVMLVSDCPGPPLPSGLGVWVCFWRGKVVSDARAGSASTACAVWTVRQKITLLSFKYHDFLLFLFFSFGRCTHVCRKKKKSERFLPPVHYSLFEQ